MASLADYMIMGGPGDVSTGDFLEAMPRQPSNARRVANTLSDLAQQLPRSTFDAAKEAYSAPSLASLLSLAFAAAPGQPNELAKMVLGTGQMGASGVDNVQRGYEEGDTLRGIGGAGQIALAALPMTKAAGPLYASMPRAMGTTGVTVGAATVPLAVTEARAQDKAKAATIQAPEHLVKERDDARRELQDLNRAYDAMNDKHRRSGPETQRGALEPLKGQIRDAQRKIEKIEDSIRLHGEESLARMKAEAPFRERYPGAAETIFAGGAMLAGGLPFATTVRNRIGDAVEGALINRQARKTTDMLQGGRNDTRAVENQLALQRRVDRFEETPGIVSTGMKHGLGATMSAMTMAEAASLPEQIDYVSFSPGHPTRQAAAEAFQTPGYYGERIGPALMGAGLYGTGVKLGQAVTPNPAIKRNLVDDALQYGNADHLNRLQELRQFRDAARAVRESPRPKTPDGPPYGPSGTPGPGQLPAQAGGPSALPDRQNIPSRTQGASDRGAYGPSEQSVARPHITGEIAAGRNVPTVEELSTYLKGQGLNKPLPANLEPKVNALTNLVHELRSSGMADKQVSEIIARLMQSGKNHLPAIATGTALGAGYMTQPTDE